MLCVHVVSRCAERKAQRRARGTLWRLNPHLIAAKTTHAAGFTGSVITPQARQQSLRYEGPQPCPFDERPWPIQTTHGAGGSSTKRLGRCPPLSSGAPDWCTSPTSMRVSLAHVHVPPGGRTVPQTSSACCHGAVGQPARSGKQSARGPGDRTPAEGAARNQLGAVAESRMAMRRFGTATLRGGQALAVWSAIPITARSTRRTTTAKFQDGGQQAKIPASPPPWSQGRGGRHSARGMTVSFRTHTVINPVSDPAERMPRLLLAAEQALRSTREQTGRHAFCPHTHCWPAIPGHADTHR
jgi:hypothetical protein